MRLALSIPLLSCGILFAAIPVEPGGTIFENDQVKVVRALEKPHVKGKAHEHKMNRVMVYLQSGQQRFEYQDGRKPETFNWKAGQVTFSPSNGTHAPEVLSDSPFNIVEVELKQNGSSHPMKAVALDPLKVDPKHYHLEFENDQVRVLRVTIGGHESAPMHEHALNRVSIYLTDQDFKATTKEGKSDTAHHKAGDAAWGTPLTHTETNESAKPFEVVVVELK